MVACTSFHYICKKKGCLSVHQNEFLKNPAGTEVEIQHLRAKTGSGGLKITEHHAAVCTGPERSQESSGGSWDVTVITAQLHWLLTALNALCGIFFLHKIHGE